LNHAYESPGSQQYRGDFGARFGGDGYADAADELEREWQSEHGGSAKASERRKKHSRKAEDPAGASTSESEGEDDQPRWELMADLPPS
jgi:hypothetical protein